MITMAMIETCLDIAALVAPPPFGAVLADVDAALKKAGPAGDIFLATLDKMISGQSEEEIRRAVLPGDDKIMSDLMADVATGKAP